MLKSSRALFLDRDGVVNEDYGYVYKIENFHFIDGVFELVKEAKNLGYLVILITNQAGIGRGYFTENQFFDLMEWVSGQFSLHGGSIDKIYFCPYHPDYGIGKYKRRSIFRKPGPGMILKAAKDCNLDLRNSVLVGDKDSDIMAGITAGVGRNILYSPKVEAGVNKIDGIRIKSLLDAKKYLI